MTTFERSEGAQPWFDLHAWTSTWASIEEAEAEDPAAALSQYADLVEGMLAASGHRLDDVVAVQGEDPEIVVSYRAARQTAERAEVGAASRSEVELAIDDLRDVFATVSGKEGE